MIPIARPIIGDEEKRAVLEVLDSGVLAQGEKIAEFEHEFAKFIGVGHAIATSNGTAALHVALLAHDIKAGDEVITSPFSFIATANAIRMCGAVPVFVDIEEETFNLDPKLIEAAITPKTKAILPVHLFGQSCNMTSIMDIAQRYNLIIVEDACQAHGTLFQGKKVGSFGTGCFSFYPTKNMTTGEGGMVTTNDELAARRIRKIINHGATKRYYHDILGFNYRMTELAAAMGREQLKKLPALNNAREKNASQLTEKLLDIDGLITPKITPGHVFHQYTIRITQEFRFTRDQVSEMLKLQQVDNAIFYPLPIHQQEAYAAFQFFKLPVAEKVAKEVLSLPVHPSLTTKEIDSIAQKIKELAYGQK